MKWYNRLNYNFILKLTFSVLAVSAVFYSVSGGFIREMFFNSIISKAKVVAESGAVMIGRTLEDAVSKGMINGTDLFNARYTPIPNTKPEKFKTQYDDVTDLLFPVIQDSYMIDDELTYAVAENMDKYVPTHNAKYAKPLTGNYERDLNNNRTKRFFNDSINLKIFENASRIEKGSLAQSYERDTGELFWDISAPIFVSGKKWGIFRVGMTTKNIDIKLDEFKNLMLMMITVLLLSVAGIVIFQLKRITGPVIEISKHLERISSGDISADLNIDTPDNEIGLLVKYVNGMTSSLKEILAEQRDAIDEIDASVARLRSSMTEEASAVTQQTAAITETASTMEELNAIAHEIESNSQKIVQTIRNNIETTNISKAAMKELHSVISGISDKNSIYTSEIYALRDKSRRIEEVMRVIDEIADQTKLIAFNATIESVGSGEMGRRFIVIAEEIRRLADNVMRSTDEIKSKIKEIGTTATNILEMSKAETREIERSVDSFNTAEESFVRVIEMSGQSSSLIENIADSISQQKEATSQVLNAIKDISDGAILVNERVTENLDGVNSFRALSARLKTIMDGFKL